MLSDTTVVSVSGYLAGPFATRLLGDLGAEVIKVENPSQGDPFRFLDMPYDEGTPDGLTYRFLEYNRGKQSLAVDISSGEGRDVIYELASEADVFLENQRQGKVDELGIGYDDLREVNEDLVYCSISGYGETGPYRSYPAMDALIQAAGGLADYNGVWAGEPTFTSLMIVDVLGAMYAVQSVLAGLVSSRGGNGGTYIDLSLMDALVSVFGREVAEYSATGDVGSDLTVGLFPWGLYETADGRITIIVRDHNWRPFCEALALEEWLDSGEFDDLATRQANKDVIEERIEAVLRQEPTDHWVDRLLDAGVLVSPVNSVAEAFEHEQVRHRNVVRQVHDAALGEFSTLVFPGQFTGYEVDESAPAPRLGEHTEPLLSALGYSRDSISDLRERGIVTTGD
jgi:formyl-CoA transferase